MSPKISYFFLTKKYFKVDVQMLGQLLINRNIKGELVIVQKDMTDSLTQTIKETTIDSLKTHNDLGLVCSKITSTLIQKLGGAWHCVKYKTSFGSYSITKYGGKYIHFSIFNLTFVIFQTKD